MQTTENKAQEEQAVQTGQTEQLTANAVQSSTRTFFLSEPLTTGDGRVLMQLTLRKGTVKDMRTAQRDASTDIDYELNLFALLTVEKLTPEDLEGMDMDDYGVIQNWFRTRRNKRG